MKKILMAITFISLCFFTVGCFEETTKVSPKTAEEIAKEQVEQKLQHEQVLQDNADWAIEKIQYIKDPRTGLCFAFAYYRSRYDPHGVYVLTTVPSESIPPELLTIASCTKTK